MSLFRVSVHFGAVDEIRFLVKVAFKFNASLLNGIGLNGCPSVRSFSRNLYEAIHLILVGRHVLSGADDSIHSRFLLVDNLGQSACGTPNVHFVYCNRRKLIFAFLKFTRIPKLHVLNILVRQLSAMDEFLLDGHTQMVNRVVLPVRIVLMEVLRLFHEFLRGHCGNDVFKFVERFR